MKLTKLEKQWILYDVGNSAFVLITVAILPIYFNSLSSAAGISETNYLAYWMYATSLSTLIVALIGPILGTIADNKGYKIKIFVTSLMFGVCALASLSLPSSWLMLLALFVFAKVAYSVSIIFYDSMLSDITSPERMDVVSMHGYAWGYIGGCVPFVVSIMLILFSENLNLSMGLAMTLAFVLNALWWLITSLPLIKNYKQVHYVEKQDHIITNSFKRLGETFRKLRKQKKILYFMIAFFFYIDGVYTIIDSATAFGKALGLNSNGLLLALLLTQIVAFPCALFFASLSKKIDNTKLIRVCIFAYTCIALFAIQLDQQWEFWALAVAVGFFQGGIQALSRSYFASIIPPENSGEYFGLFDICGKGASILGSLLIGLVAQITGNPNIAIAFLTVLFIVGYFMFNKAVKEK